MNICIVVGARPNFIKVAPIIRAIAKAHEEGRDISYKLVFTGGENDKTIEDSLFDDLEINRPDSYLGVDCENLNELTEKIQKFNRNDIFAKAINDIELVRKEIEKHFEKLEI